MMAGGAMVAAGGPVAATRPGKGVDRPRLDAVRERAAPLRSGPKSFLTVEAPIYIAGPPSSSRRDLASVVRVLLGGNLISRSALAGPIPDHVSLRGGYRVGTDFRVSEVIRRLDVIST
jgi:hypothetical protein